MFDLRQCGCNGFTALGISPRYFMNADPALTGHRWLTRNGKLQIHRFFPRIRNIQGGRTALILHHHHLKPAVRIMRRQIRKLKRIPWIGTPDGHLVNGPGSPKRGLYPENLFYDAGVKILLNSLIWAVLLLFISFLVMWFTRRKEITKPVIS